MSRRSWLFRLTLAELPFIILFTVLFALGLVSAENSELEDRGATLESEIERLESENKRSREKIKELEEELEEFRIKPPTEWWFPTIFILGVDRYRIEGKGYTFAQITRYCRYKELFDKAKQEGCVPRAKVVAYAALDLRTYDRALQKLEQIFYVRREILHGSR